MLKGIYSTLSGKHVTERRMDMLSHNIANSLTPGYKSSRPAVNITREESQASSDGASQGTYVSSIDSYTNFSEAPLVQSGSNLDLAIEGNGFFVISTPKGTMYTRNGQFTLDQNKRLVTMEGNPVMGQGGEITVDGKDVKVESDGSVYVDNGTQDIAKILVGVVKVVDFKDRKDLKPAGNTLFVNTDDKSLETTPEKFSIKQGFHEASNVNVMQELIELISTMRAYESYTKVDQFFSDMMTKLMDMGRV
jgi:flagellar basal-body rod protein FlgF